MTVIVIYFLPISITLLKTNLWGQNIMADFATRATSKTTYSSIIYIPESFGKASWKTNLTYCLASGGKVGFGKWRNCDSDWAGGYGFN